MFNNVNKNPFYFVRHGETDWNKQGFYQGQRDIPLNETGIEQAKLIAQILKNEPIAHIITSPLLRAQKTAAIINEQLNKPISILDDLRELALGDMEGKLISDGTVFDNWLLGITPAGAENAVAFDARVKRGLLKGLSLPAPALFVAHGAVFTAIRRMLKLPLHRIQNCEIVYHHPSFSDNDHWLSTILK